MSDLDSNSGRQHGGSTSRRRFLTRTATAGTAAVAVWSIPTVESFASTGTSGSPFIGGGGEAPSFVAILYQIGDGPAVRMKFNWQGATESGWGNGTTDQVIACDPDRSIIDAVGGDVSHWDGVGGNGAVRYDTPTNTIVVTMPDGSQLLDAILKKGRTCQAGNVTPLTTEPRLTYGFTWG